LRRRSATTAQQSKAAVSSRHLHDQRPPMSRQLPRGFGHSRESPALFDCPLERIPSTDAASNRNRPTCVTLRPPSGTKSKPSFLAIGSLRPCAHSEVGTSRRSARSVGGWGRPAPSRASGPAWRRKGRRTSPGIAVRPCGWDRT
jgi:hypothetical protein